MNNEPEFSPESGQGAQIYETVARHKNYKKLLSRIGLAVTATVVLSQGLFAAVSALAERFIPDIYAAEWFYWVSYIIIMYGIAFPAAFLILAKLPTYKTPNGEDAHPRALDPLEITICLVVSMCLTYAGNYIGQAINALLEASVGAPSSSGLNDLVFGSGILWIILVTDILAPIFEELLFRRFLIRRLRHLGDKTAIFISAMMFALMHGNIEQLVYTFLLGLLLGFIYVKTDSLLSTVILHGLINFFGGTLTVLIVKYVLGYATPDLLVSELEAILSSSGTTYAEMLSAMQPVVVLAALGAFTMTMATVGFILLVHYKKQIKLCRGSESLDRRLIGDTVFMAPGMMIFIIACLALICLAVVVRA